MSCIFQKARVRPWDLRRICVWGAFGQYLQIHNAQDIGLPPVTPIQHVKLCGNTALASRELLLFDPDREGTLASLKTKTRIISPSQAREFEDEFIEGLYVQPMRRD